jgi:hypothetical protein
VCERERERDSERERLFRDGGMAQVLEHLPSKHEALN